MNYTIEDIIEELGGFVHWLADRKQSDTILMDVDELIGELYEELVKGFQYYQSRDLTKGQMCAVLRRMFDNRVGELVYKHYKTHRKDGNFYTSLDELEVEHDDDRMLRVQPISITNVISVNPATPQELMESQERFLTTRARLSTTAQRVLDAIVNGNELLMLNIQLAGDRYSYTRKGNSEMRMRPWYVADSLGMDEVDVILAFSEIKRVYAEVCNEFGD